MPFIFICSFKELLRGAFQFNMNYKSYTCCEIYWPLKTDWSSFHKGLTDWNNLRIMLYSSYGGRERKGNRRTGRGDKLSHQSTRLNTSTRAEATLSQNSTNYASIMCKSVQTWIPPSSKGEPKCKQRLVSLLKKKKRSLEWIIQTWIQNIKSRKPIYSLSINFLKPKFSLTLSFT